MDVRESSSLAAALFTPVQQRVLGLLFGQPERSYQSAEIIRLVGSGTGAVHRQLQQLSSTGLVTATRLGNQKYYQANAASPVFTELHGLVVKTVGLLGPLRSALAPLKDRVAAAWVFGSVAEGRETSRSDIDIMVISDTVTHPELFEALQAAEQTLGRQLNPVLLTPKDWQAKRARPGSFAERMSGGTKLFVIGDEDAIA